MHRSLAVITFFAFTQLLFAQFPVIEKIEIPGYDKPIEFSSIISTADNNLIFFWADSSILYSARTSDYGETWEATQTITDDLFSRFDDPDINPFAMSNGRLLVTYQSKGHNLRYSDDNGVSWSDPIELNTGGSVIKQRVGASRISESSDSLYFCYSLYSNDIYLRGTSYYITSSDGISWTDEPVTIHENLPVRSGYFNLYFPSPSTRIEFYQENSSGSFDIFKKTVDVSNLANSDTTIILSSNSNYTRPKLLIDKQSILWLFYEAEIETPNEAFKPTDICYIKSSDEGDTWSDPEKFTQYSGYDSNFEVTLINDKPAVLFSSTRSAKSQSPEIANYNVIYTKELLSDIWFGIAGESLDIVTPPVIYNYKLSYEINHPTFEILFESLILDDDVDKVEMNYQINQSEKSTLMLHDDGLNGDLYAGDSIYSATIENLAILDTVNFNLSASDFANNKSESMEFIAFANLPDPYYATLVDVNNILLPIDNKGILADVEVIFPDSSLGYSGVYDNKSFLFSGGFYLGGINNGIVWANAMATATRDQHYLAGPVGSEAENWNNALYIVKSSDEPFGKSWQDWGFAVELGADYYDGNGDGVYSPVDLNENGQWDKDEDKPDLIGDYTAWCIYNDGMESSLRSFNNVEPLGIEIKQTVFGYSEENMPELDDVLFIRYEIENTGLVSDKLDSVYFGAWSDPDIGDYSNDLVGSNIFLSSGYVYDNGNDNEYGNSPAFFTSIVQGPHTFIPGETFLDENENGVYDEGIDTPLDTSTVNKGPVIGQSIIPGSRSLSSSSFIHNISSHPTIGDPVYEQEAYNLLKGLDKIGNELDPCDWEYGEVRAGIHCNSVDPFHWYNGDPVQNVGWICSFDDDQRMMINVGLFQLKANEPVEVIVAYCVGRGETSLESVEVTREIVKTAHAFYSTNFTNIPTSLNETTNNQQPATFRLEQNYPNPFNPSTKIKYTIAPLSGGAGGGLVAIKIFDILGREVQTLVNKAQAPGNYEIEFDGSQLASGVYFYQLKAGDYISTKKMILLK